MTEEIIAEFKVLLDNSLELFKGKKYVPASKQFEIAIGILEKHSRVEKDSICPLKADLAFMLCLGKKYKEATEVLKPIIQIIERNEQFKGDVLEQAYCTYSICLYETGEYLKSIFYYEKFLALIKDSKIHVYDSLKSAEQKQKDCTI